MLQWPRAAALHKLITPNSGAVRLEGNLTVPETKATRSLGEAAWGDARPGDAAGPRRALPPPGAVGGEAGFGVLGRQQAGCSRPPGAQRGARVPSADTPSGWEMG